MTNHDGSVRRPSKPAGICHSSFASSHSGVFLVGDEVEAHEDEIVPNGLHVLHVVRQAKQLAEAMVREYFHRVGLFADELGLEFLQSELEKLPDELNEEKNGRDNG